MHDICNRSAQFIQIIMIIFYRPSLQHIPIDKNLRASSLVIEQPILKDPFGLSNDQVGICANIPLPLKKNVLELHLAEK